jgi:hypothetical protein
MLDTNTVVWAIAFPLFLFFLAIGVGTVFAMTSSDSAGFFVAKAALAAAAFVAIAVAIYWVIATRQNVPWNIVIPTITAVIVVPGLVLALQWVGYREIWLSTRLFPANLPTPPTPPTPPIRQMIPEAALKVFLGPTLAWATKMPHTILMMNGEKMIEIDKDQARDELVVKTLRIFDDRNNIIARICGFRRRRPAVPIESGQ